MAEDRMHKMVEPKGSNIEFRDLDKITNVSPPVISEPKAPAASSPAHPTTAPTSQVAEYAPVDYDG